MSRPDLYMWEYLADIWNKYEQQEEIAKYWEGTNRLVADARLQLRLADRAKSLVSVSDTWEEEWLEVLFNDHTLNHGVTKPGYPYAFNVSVDLKSLPTLVDYPDNPIQTFRYIEDYIFEDKLIYFKEDPRLIGFDQLRIKDNNDKVRNVTRLLRFPRRLYCDRAKYTFDIVYRNFGYDISYEPTGNPWYKEEVQGLYYCLNSKRTRENLQRLLNITMGSNLGFGFAFGSDLVKSIDKSEFHHVITTLNKSYLVPYFLDLSVTKYDDDSSMGQLNQFQSLSSAVKVFDYHSNPDWFGKSYATPYPDNRFFLMLYFINKTGFEAGTFSDNGIWDDGEEEILPYRYTTHLDDVKAATPQWVKGQWDDGGYFDYSGSYDDKDKFNFYDRGLANEIFEDTKDNIIIAEFDKHSITKTTYNRQGSPRLFRHLRILANVPFKELYFGKRNIIPSSKILYNSRAITETFSQNMYYDVEYLKRESPVSNILTEKDGVVIEYPDNIVPRDVPKNIDIDPVDMKTRVSPILQGFRPPGTEVIMITEELDRTKLTLKLKDIAHGYKGKDELIGRFDETEDATTPTGQVTFVTFFDDEGDYDDTALATMYTKVF